MSIIFPDPEEANPEGIVAVGGRPLSENLKVAYAAGIFPWPHEGLPLLWFSPPERGVIDFSTLHIPRTLQRQLKKTSFEVRWNTSFEQVISACASAVRKGSTGTWITPEMARGYTQAHREGWAHSVEVFSGSELVGGLYGVSAPTYFSAESMFYKVSPASAFALIHLIRQLKRLGFQWLDVQMITPVTERFGGRYIERSEFLKRLRTGPEISWSAPPASTAQLTREEIRWLEESS